MTFLLLIAMCVTTIEPCDGPTNPDTEHDNFTEHAIYVDASRMSRASPKIFQLPLNQWRITAHRDCDWVCIKRLTYGDPFT